MKTAQNLVIGMLAMVLIGANVGFSSPLPNAGVPTKIVVTVTPSAGVSTPQILGADDLAVMLGKTPARVIGSQRLTGDLAEMQLFVLLDDSTRSSSLGLQLPYLKAFIGSLPPTTEVAVGYMQNGAARVVQEFTTDHQKAASSLRLPQSIAGGNGSPYFTLSDLVKHWPSKQATGRHTVLMLTDGVDRYYDNSMVDDPYVDESIHDALKQGVMVYSIYLRDAGLYDRGGQTTLFAQSRLIQVSDQTGGHAYFQDFTDPVTISPFLNDLQNRLDRQYQVTVDGLGKKGVQPVQVRSELHGVKIQGPTRIYLQ
ncbi:MAG: hypothetical protein ACLPWF_28080 [Bryobacteraceae bacterium]